MLKIYIRYITNDERVFKIISGIKVYIKSFVKVIILYNFLFIKTVEFRTMFVSQEIEFRTVLYHRKQFIR